MLGWALNKATGNASSNAPPTPGPGKVDSCRISCGNTYANCSLIFFIDDTYIEQPDTPAPVFAARAFKRAIFGTPAPPQKETTAKMETKANVAKPAKAITTIPVTLDRNSFESPSKPQGILLTPGTGTTRRKRVSFGRDVKSNQVVLGDTDGTNRARPKTKLQEALENSRKRRQDRRSDNDDARKVDFDPDADDGWEEVEEFDREPDITIDLNEPRSQSGQYWKNEFQRYHEEARAEMEKLVKYKQLAKSYAKAKDAEALDLNERLREEQEKVDSMEQRITELAAQIAGKQGRIGGVQDDHKMMKDLTRQKALAVQYRTKVEELEALLKGSGYEAAGSTRRRPLATNQTAREQAQELVDLRRELQRVKSNLSALEDQEAKLETEKKDLERRLSRKEKQYDNLKTDYDALREKNKSLRDEVSSLRRDHKVSSSDDADLLRDDLKLLSTGHNGPSPYVKKLEDLQFKLREKEEAPRRDMEDASVNVNQLRQAFKATSERKPPAQRNLSAELRAKLSNKTPKFDEETLDLLQHRRSASNRLGQTPTIRSVSRINKRSVSGPPIGKQLVATERRASTPRSIDLVRIGSKSRLGLVSERALDSQSESDPEVKLSSGTSRNAVSKATLSSDRRAAAISRLEQKRAERKKARERGVIPGKENLRP